MLFKKRVPAKLDRLPRKFGPYVIKWAGIPDLRQIAEMEFDFFPEPLSFWALLRLWLKANTYYIVIKHKNQVAAFIGFQLLGPIAHTISMGVHPFFRRQGLAGEIQKTAETVAQNRGARWFTGEIRLSNTPQLKFIRKHRWLEIGLCPQFFGNGEDAVVVWRFLSGGEYWLRVEDH